MPVPRVGVAGAEPVVCPITMPGRRQNTDVEPTAGGKDLDRAVRKDALIRVLHVVNGELFSGAERVQSHLGRCLPAEGFEADFACVKPGQFYERLLGQPGHGRGIDVAMRHRLDWSAASRLADETRQGGYEILHAHTPRTAMITAMVSRRVGVPWVYHVHSPASRDCSQGMRNWINAIVESRSLRSAAAIITVSHSLKRDYVRGGVWADRIRVVSNGVPVIRPSRLSTPRPGSRWVIGMVALMRPRKGLEVAIDAIRLIRDAGHDVVLRCIGEFETDSYRHDILRRIDQAGVADSIEMTGFVDDVPAALAGIDAMVLPSLYGEGLPMVVLESMAAGTPVVATRVEGTPEAITHGVEGLLAEPNSSQSLASEISRLITGDVDWSAMAEAAARRHGEDFSDHAMAAGVAAVYRDVIAD